MLVSIGNKTFLFFLSDLLVSVFLCWKHLLTLKGWVFDLCVSLEFNHCIRINRIGRILLPSWRLLLPPRGVGELYLKLRQPNPTRYLKDAIAYVVMNPSNAMKGTHFTVQTDQHLF